MAERAPLLLRAFTCHRNSCGEKLTFSPEHAATKWFYLNAHNIQNLAVKKSVQCGISEFGICENMYDAERGLALFTVLPNENNVKGYIQLRINSLVDGSDNASPYYSSLIGNTDQVHLKLFGKGRLKTVASNAKANFKEYPADKYIIEELDECDQDNIQLAEGRISNSKYKIRRIFSNPSVCDYGIDEVYQKGTQEKWFVKCTHCNEWQNPDWFDNFVAQTGDETYEVRDIQDTHPNEIHTKLGLIHFKSPDNPQPMCIKCGRPIAARGPGEYVAEHPDRNWRTFEISKLVSPQNTYFELMSFWFEACGDYSRLQWFYNEVLGLAFTQPGARLSDEMMDACITGYSCQGAQGHPVIAGMDVGSRNRIIIADARECQDKPRIIHASLCSFADAEFFMNHYNIDFLVVDALPETQKAKELRDKFPGRVWLCYYSETQKEPKLTESGPDGEVYCRIDVARTESLDASHATILRREIEFPAAASALAEGLFYTEMKGTTRIFNEDKGRFEWTKGQDHFRHSYNYMTLAHWILTTIGQTYESSYIPSDEQVGGIYA